MISEPAQTTGSGAMIPMSFLAKLKKSTVSLLHSNVEHQQDKYLVAINQCIGCGNCKWRSPTMFAMKDVPGRFVSAAYVLKQPDTPQDLELFKDGMACCPANAIYGPAGNRRGQPPPNSSSR